MAGMTTRRHPHIVHRDEIDPTTIERGKHRMVRRSFTQAAGNQQLGGSLIEVAPGAMSYPFHHHAANEEAIYILSGSGIARIGDARVAVRAGDWIAYPVGPDNAHQMINDGDVPLVYLAIATDHKVDVIGYPDSGKVAAWAGEKWQAMRAGESLDYWDGEPDA
jgi:uncharacterized cupin superfamily protein